jgi:hypothetical protein
MTALLAACIGLVAGIHAATWGMYKDAPHEGFSRRKFARSPVLGAVLAPGVSAAALLDPRRAGDMVLLFGVTYALERALAEIYKTFLRQEDQGKYFIPMQLHVLGKVVQSRAARLAAGLLYTTGGDRVHHRDDRDLQDLLLPLEASGQVRRDAAPVSRDAAPPAAVRAAVHCHLGGSSGGDRRGDPWVSPCCSSSRTRRERRYR